MRRIFRLGALLLAVGLAGGSGKAAEKTPLLLVIMDPLAKELACACVTGYGQRDYRKLAAWLESDLKQQIIIEFSDDLVDTLVHADAVREVIVIGDRALVAHGAHQAKLPCQPLCELTGLDGHTTVTASFVVRSKDPAKELKDIGGRQLLFGMPQADAKHAAALGALRALGVEPPANTATRATYTDAALDVLDSSATPPPVGVIPSYGVALLTGCGSVKPGELRVIGSTEPAPFITVFVAGTIAPEKKDKILSSLLGLKRNATLLKALESRDGFKPLKATSVEPLGSVEDWPDWRGQHRAGRVPSLPTRLPTQPKLIWKRATMPGGLAGLSVSGSRLIVAERDFAEEHDVYRCLNADTGETLWRVMFPASGHLDYGQSPRATPVFYNGHAFLLGAFGELRCVDITTGDVLWKRHLPSEFNAELPTWGMCAPPLVVDDRLIVNPGGEKASLAALDCASGRTLWTTAGPPAAYAPFICGEFGGRRQIVGYDSQSLGGWDVMTGQRLWQLVPPVQGDFNVPTPIAVDGSILVATENNGTRLYHFDATGRIIPQPAAEYAALSPETATPVVTRDRVFGVDQGLYCLDARDGLKPIWQREETTFGDHAALLADGERVLVITINGELILLDAQADDCAIISRSRLFDKDVEVYPHPALVGTRLYARGGSSLVCLDLRPD